MNLIDDSNVMEAATALAELRKTHLQALAAAAPSVGATPVQTAPSSTIIPIPPPSKGTKFPMRMHTLLSDPSISHIITWLPHGKSFVILRPDILATRILPLYFSQDKSCQAVRYTSFTRKMNRWGFRQISNGPDSGAFYHDLFRREDPEACRGMVCAKSRKSGKDAKSVSSSSTEGMSVRGGNTSENKGAVVSAAVTVSTSGVSARSSLPLKKRRGLSSVASVGGIPSNVEMKPNNTSLLTKRGNSYESSLSSADDDRVSTVSKESNTSNAVFADQQAYQARQVAKKTLEYYFQQAKEARDVSQPAPSVVAPFNTVNHTTATSTPVNLSAQQAAVDSAKKALARNFHEQYKSYVLASLLKNSHMAMEARGMDVDTSSVSSTVPTQGPKHQVLPTTNQAVEESPVRRVTADSATQAQHCEAAKAAKSALYEAYRKAISTNQ